MHFGLIGSIFTSVKVLLATDGSIEADLAEVLLSRLPLAKPTVMVAMVVHTPMAVPLAPLGGGEFIVDSFRIEREIAERTVESVAERVRASGADTDALVVQGDTATELLDLIHRVGFDLVASGTSMESTLRAFFLGSVSRKLALYSECSTLVARHFRHEQAEGSAERLSTKAKLDLLVAVDGTPGSASSVDSLSALRDRRFGTVTVLSVAPAGSLPANAVVPADIGDLSSEASPFAELAASTASSIEGCADRVEAVVASGRPSEEIGKVAEARDVDLIVMGATRHGAIERLILGSCAYETVASAPCSVLVLRKPIAFV